MAGKMVERPAGTSGAERFDEVHGGIVGPRTAVAARGGGVKRRLPPGRSTYQNRKPRTASMATIFRAPMSPPREKTSMSNAVRMKRS